MKTLFRQYAPFVGFYPGIVADTALGTINFSPFNQIEFKENYSRFIYSEPTLFCGHNIMESEEFPLVSDADKYIPLSPLFARDIAGRIIYLGMGPEQKTGDEWPLVDIIDPMNMDDVDLEIILSEVLFPRHCRSTIGMEGADELETVFLTRFRNLEIGLTEGQPASGGTDPEVGVYERANLYPYKLRPDTFYIDGYKLPQTNMLFARGEDEGIHPAAAQKLGEALLEKWQRRDTSKTWEKFFDDQGGETWAEDLFAKGCTLVPTFEACNGYNVVNENFELTDYWPGRAVLGLHSVEGSKPSKAPIGTILEVLQPGFITARIIVPARVVISDGSGYVSPNGSNPAPLLPNLHLPHTRSISQWGACWLPTHPGHFEAPALWGYDVLDSGRFVQVSGPLWDPLHYYYSCTDSILGAFDKPDSAGTTPPVPQTMINRFFPIAAPEGWDTFDAAELERRSAKNIYPRTAIVRHRNGKPGCDFGYHPLPLEYEYELEPFWMPDLHPLNRGHGLCPDDILQRLAPVIIPPIGAEPYRRSLKVPEDAPWFTDENLLASPSVDPVECYPQLARYVLPDIDPRQWLPLFPAPYLAEPRREMLFRSAQELWEGMDEAEDLQAIAPGLDDVLHDAKEEGLALMRYRHHLYRTKKILYKLGWWYGLNVDELTALDQESETAATPSQTGRQNSTRVAQVARAAAQGEAEPEQTRRRAAPAANMPVVRNN
jgi:hypothetical protein